MVEPTNTSTAKLRPARCNDIPLLAAILAEAFRDDPLVNWMLNGPRATGAVFAAMLRHVYLPAGRVELLGSEGAAAWLPHDAPRDLPMLVRLRLMVLATMTGGFGVVGRVAALEKAMVTQRPDTPHLYLFAIGVRRRARGLGLGGRLMDPVLAACDERGEAVYLENSNPANHGFYASRGFETLSVFQAARGAPDVEAMWRKPR
jgi:ribosomal protein S18 acetylase RimI-like enzyme